MGYAGDALDERAGDWASEQRVSEGGRVRSPSGETVCKAEDVVVERANAALVTMGQELRFVSRHVHLDGTFRLAGLATEAQGERFIDGLALETFTLQCAGEHLPEQAGATARRVLLLAGGAVAGAHHAAIGLAACAHPHAALGSAFKGAAVGGKCKVVHRFWGSPRGRGRQIAKVFHRVINANSIGQLAGIHPVIGVPDGFELAKCLDELGAKHFRQQRGAGLSVAVLAGDGTAKAQDQVGSAVKKLAETAQALDAAEVEIDAEMDAALAEVAVKRAAVAVLAHEREEPAQVSA